jgi:YfiH family protein
MSNGTEVLELNDFAAALPWLDHGFGTRLCNIETVTMATLRQVHSSRVRWVDRPGDAGEADALVTSAPGLGLSIRSADCYPILLADPRTRSVAAIHAGWKGTASRIVAEAASKMRADFGSDPADLHAAIGPGIGGCCYEVGPEVALRFGLEGRRKIDLAEINRRTLIESGVPASQIYILNRCTRCEPDVFHSYRRDGDRAGRMISFVRIRT